MKRAVISLLTIVIFAGKYIQLSPQIPVNISLQLLALMEYWGNIIIEISFSLIFLIAFFMIDGRWRFYAMTLSIVGLSSFIFSLFYGDIIFYIFSQIMLFTSFFFILYPLFHYEIKKYASFGYFSSLIYVLLEGISIWRGDFSYIIFLVYLTFTFILFLPGIAKMRE